MINMLDIKKLQNEKIILLNAGEKYKRATNIFNKQKLY